MLILGIIWLHRHLNITSSVWIQKVVKFIICAVIAIAGLILLFINFLAVFLGLDDKETVTRKENGYTYLEVSWSHMGYNAYTEEYVTNNPFIMKKIYVPTKDDTFTNEQPVRTIQKIMTRQITIQKVQILIQKIVIHRIIQNHMKVMNG